MITVKQLKAVNTLDDLESLGIGEVIYDIGHRGGYLGFYGRDIATAFEIPVEYLPDKYGVYCNYLGGGLRGSICGSGFDKAIKPAKAGKLMALAAACKRVYLNLESDSGIPDDPINTGLGRVNVESAY